MNQWRQNRLISIVSCLEVQSPDQCQETAFPNKTRPPPRDCIFEQETSLAVVFCPRLQFHHKINVLMYGICIQKVDTQYFVRYIRQILHPQSPSAVTHYCLLLFERLRDSLVIMCVGFRGSLSPVRLTF